MQQLSRAKLSKLTYYKKMKLLKPEARASGFAV